MCYMKPDSVDRGVRGSPVLDEVAQAQLLDLLPVNRGLVAEVEAVKLAIPASGGHLEG